MRERRGIGDPKSRSETMSNEYHQGDTIYILMAATRASSLMEDWLHYNYECDLLIHRSKKNKGKVVIETHDLMWASRIIQWHSYEQVTYKHPKQ